jgi:class 3 adenylate cyclase
MTETTLAQSDLEQDVVAEAVRRESERGERLVAKVRLGYGIVGLLGSVGMVVSGYTTDAAMHARALIGGALPALWAVGWWWYVSHRPYRRAMGYASVLMDSALLYGAFLVDPPDPAHDPLQLNALVSLAVGGSPLTFFLFFLIATSALRQDFWLCVVSAVSAALLHGIAVARALPIATPATIGVLLDPSMAPLLWGLRTFAFVLTVAVIALATRNGWRMARRAGHDGLEQARLLNVFGKYVDPEVARGALAGSAAETREVTVLFTDLRDFTALSESLPPSEVLALLNAHCAAIIPVAHRHGGTVNKFIGDAIMATFGAPVAYADHAERAVRAGLEMLEATDRLNHQLRAQGRPVLRMGVGIATGPVVLGPLGAEDRMEYAVLGDTVNTASRLEGMNKPLGTSLLLSERTRAALGPGLEVRALGEVALKGKEKPVAVFTVARGPSAG